jgi:hypothetical protein
MPMKLMLVILPLLYFTNEYASVSTLNRRKREHGNSVTSSYSFKNGKFIKMCTVSYAWVDNNLINLFLITAYFSIFQALKDVELIT